MNIETIIERFIINELLVDKGYSRIAPNEDLVDSGILDSLALLNLITFIEAHFDVTIEDGDLDPDNFQSINVLKTFLEAKMEKV